MKLDPSIKANALVDGFLMQKSQSAGGNCNENYLKSGSYTAQQIVNVGYLFRYCR